MSNTQHSPFASPYSYSPPGAISTPNNLACTIVSEGGTDFYTVVVPAAGTFDAGANPMTLTTIYPGLLAKIVNNQAGDFLVKGSKVGDPGVLCLAGATTVVTDDGKGNLMEVANSSTSGSSGTGPLFTSARVRGAVNQNIADKAAFPVAQTGGGQEGITYVQGDLVLLMGQTAPAENGPYFVGAVVAGNAPLTRPAWWAPGSTIPEEFEFLVSMEGANFGGLTAAARCVAAKIVDTDDPVLRWLDVGGLVVGQVGPVYTYQRGLGAIVRNGAGDYTITVLSGFEPNKSIVELTSKNGGAVAQTFDIVATTGTTIRIECFAAGVAGDFPFMLSMKTIN